MIVFLGERKMLGRQIQDNSVLSATLAQWCWFGVAYPNTQDFASRFGCNVTSREWSMEVQHVGALQDWEQSYFCTNCQTCTRLCLQLVHVVWSVGEELACEQCRSSSKSFSYSSSSNKQSDIGPSIWYNFERTFTCQGWSFSFNVACLSSCQTNGSWKSGRRRQTGDRSLLDSFVDYEGHFAKLY